VRERPAPERAAVAAIGVPVAEVRFLQLGRSWAAAERGAVPTGRLLGAWRVSATATSSTPVGQVRCSPRL